VANLAHARSDDRWSALDGRHLYSWCRTVGFLYEAHLRAELTRRLGVLIPPFVRGKDVRQVPHPFIHRLGQVDQGRVEVIVLIKVLA
ncbi:hypothetical protein EO238_28335, partial [Citrobacter sp. AAK_AS5]